MCGEQKGDNKFDCSGFAYWAVHEVNPSLGSKLYTNAAGQAKYCYEHGYSMAGTNFSRGISFSGRKDLLRMRQVEGSSCRHLYRKRKS